MDRTGLDGAFLAACCRFTMLALVVASVLISAVVSYLGFGQVIGSLRIADTSNIHSHVPRSFFAGLSPVNSESQEESELLPCQPADASSLSLENRGLQTAAWSPAHPVSSVTARTGYLKLDHLSVDTVVTRHGERGISQLTVFFSNFSCRSGMVQMRPEVSQTTGYRSAGGCNEASAQWQRRRVPRHGQLAYSVVIPCSGNAATLRLHVRGFSSDRVLTVQQVGTFVREAQLVENKSNIYIGSTHDNNGFHSLSDSDRQIADNI